MKNVIKALLTVGLLFLTAFGISCFVNWYASTTMFDSQNKPAILIIGIGSLYLWFRIYNSLKNNGTWY